MKIHIEKAISTMVSIFEIARKNNSLLSQRD
jgi:hypothetical protein